MDGLVEVVRQPQCMIGLEPEVHAILAYNKYHVIGNAFMGSVPNHPLWKWLIPQTIKRYAQSATRPSFTLFTLLSLSLRRNVGENMSILMDFYLFL